MQTKHFVQTGLVVTNNRKRLVLENYCTNSQKVRELNAQNQYMYHPFNIKQKYVVVKVKPAIVLVAISVLTKRIAGSGDDLLLYAQAI